MPAGHGRTCENCYRSDLLDRRLAIGRSALRSERLSEAFVAFGHWLREEIGAFKASVTIDDHLGFFCALDAQWSAVPNYLELVAHFKVSGLRKAELPMRWLTTTGQVVIDAEEKRNEPERRRIQAALDRQLPGSCERETLQGYYQALSDRHESGKLSLRSLRFSVAAASQLLKIVSESDVAHPDQTALERYLKKSPGQRTTIGGFVTYLRDAKKIDLTLPPMNAGRSKLNARRKHDAEIIELASGWSGSESNVQRWIFLGLVRFHKLSRNTARRLSTTASAVRHTKNCYEVEFKNDVYRLPIRPPPTRGAQSHGGE